MEKIELNKDRADAERYYRILKDKISDFKDGEKILFVHIGNFDVLDRFISSNPNCSYFIIDQYLNLPWFKLNWPGVEVIGTNEDESIIKALDTMNKFDKIIMNPPYNGNAGLYAKITAKASQKSDDIVCLSPFIFYINEKPSKMKK